MQAVRTYTWSFKAEAAKSQLQLLLADLAKDEWTVVKRADGEAEWQAAALNHKWMYAFQFAKWGFSVCRRVRVANGVTYMFRGLQTATLSLQTGTVCKYGALVRQPVCKPSFFLPTVRSLQTETRYANCAKVSPSLQTGLSLQTEPVRKLRPTYIVHTRHPKTGKSSY